MLTRHIQNPATGHYLAMFRCIQDLVQRLYTVKPGILSILEYSELFHNCIQMHIQNLVTFTKTRHIFRTLPKIQDEVFCKNSYNI